MVNASLNWASIVGIVLAVGGALLYFMRSFKPALARDYDVFFAAIGLLCGGILFFQGWRLDPILQFGQFLLAGTTVFFAYESVRLRSVTTEQARRSSYFDDEEPAPFRPRGGLGGGYDNDTDRFDEPEPVRRRMRSRDDLDDDFYRPRRSSRAVIPERAASRERPDRDDWSEGERDRPRPRYDSEPTSTNRSTPDFGARRRDRDSERRGSRPSAAADAMPRSSRRPTTEATGPAATAGVPRGTPIQPSGRGTPTSRDTDTISDADYTPIRQPSPRPAAPPPRDNSSRFDD
ncbi:MAG: Ycf66 family protein [Cyanobacteriota bacterium]|nr:Ycf66 family protein [Cyanobacteriota bacterium]